MCQSSLRIRYRVSMFYTFDMQVKGWNHWGDKTWPLVPTHIDWYWQICCLKGTTYQSESKTNFRHRHRGNPSEFSWQFSLVDTSFTCTSHVHANSTWLWDYSGIAKKCDTIDSPSENLFVQRPVNIKHSIKPLVHWASSWLIIQHFQSHQPIDLIYKRFQKKGT